LSVRIGEFQCIFCYTLQLRNSEKLLAVREEVLIIFTTILAHAF